jgi:WD40 repeat protein
MAILVGSFALPPRSSSAQQPTDVPRCAAHNGRITRVLFSPNNQTILTTSEDGLARLWTARSGALLHTLKGHTGQIHSAAFSPDGKYVVTGSNDQTAIVWDTASGKSFHILKGHEDRIVDLAYSPDGKTVLTGSRDGTSRLWDIQTGKVLHTLDDGSNGGVVAVVVYSPDGKTVLTATLDSTARLWDVQTGKPLHTFQGHRQKIRAMASSRDGKLIATASEDRTALLWDAQTRLPLHTFEGAVTVVAFSPDGRLLLAGGEELGIWDTGTGMVRQKFPIDENGVRLGLYSPDGKSVFMANYSYLAKVYDPATGAVKYDLTDNETYSGVDAAAYSSDGQFLAVGRSMTFELWDRGMLLRRFCAVRRDNGNRFGRVTGEECSRLFADQLESVEIKRCNIACAAFFSCGRSFSTAFQTTSKSILS